MKTAGDTDPASSSQRITAVDKLAIKKQAGLLKDYLQYVPLSESKLGPYRDEEAKSKIESFLHAGFPENNWSDGQDLLQEMSAVGGPFIEIGGPSPNFTIIDIPELARSSGKKLQVTNAKPEELRQPIPEELAESVEIAGIVDGRHMKFDDGSVGAMFASGLPYMMMERFLSESARTIEPGGFLVMRAAGNMDIAVALSKGFDPVSYNRHRLTWNDGFYEDLWEIAFKKPAFKQKTLRLGRLSFTASMRQ